MWLLPGGAATWAVATGISRATRGQCSSSLLHLLSKEIYAHYVGRSSRLNAPW